MSVELSRWPRVRQADERQQIRDHVRPFPDQVWKSTHGHSCAGFTAKRYFVVGWNTNKLRYSLKALYLQILYSFIFIYIIVAELMVKHSWVQVKRSVKPGFQEPHSS